MFRVSSNPVPAVPVDSKPSHATWPIKFAPAESDAKPVEPEPDAHSDAAVAEESETGRQSSQPQDEVAPAQKPSEVPAQQEIDPRVLDHAKEILMRAGMIHEITEETAAKIWDEYFTAKNSEDFAERLNKIDAPNALKSEIWQAFEQFRNPKPSHLDRVVAAIHGMKHLASSSTRGEKSPLDVAERHPNVLRALTDASKREE